jgi:hypothetical protein
MDDLESRELVGRLQKALREKDLTAFGALLSPDVRWGDDTHPRKCRSRSDVVALMSENIARGMSAEITEIRAGRLGILCGLRVVRPDQEQPVRSMFHVYSVENSLITEIRPYDERTEASAAAGL